jgi:hypothetical protein
MARVCDDLDLAFRESCLFQSSHIAPSCLSVSLILVFISRFFVSSFAKAYSRINLCPNLL